MTIDTASPKSRGSGGTKKPSSLTVTNDKPLSFLSWKKRKIDELGKLAEVMILGNQALDADKFALQVFGPYYTKHAALITKKRSHINDFALLINKS